MIVTSTFVYIHTSRHAGQFIAPLLRLLPGARDVGYHYPLARLPKAYEGLPVIGFVRNPWDWYVSAFHDYRRKRQYVFQVISEEGRLGFDETVRRFLTLGEPGNCELLRRLRRRVPLRVNRWWARFMRGEPTRIAAALERRDLNGFPDCGYYSWLLQRMHRRGDRVVGSFGRFESLKPELLRLLEETRTPISNEFHQRLMQEAARNASPRERGYRQYFDEPLRSLVARKDHYLIDRFGYSF